MSRKKFRMAGYLPAGDFSSCAVGKLITPGSISFLQTVGTPVGASVGRLVGIEDAGLDAPSTPTAAVVATACADAVPFGTKNAVLPIAETLAKPEKFDATDKFAALAIMPATRPATLAVVLPPATTEVRLPEVRFPNGSCRVRFVLFGATMTGIAMTVETFFDTIVPLADVTFTIFVITTVELGTAAPRSAGGAPGMDGTIVGDSVGVSVGTMVGQSVGVRVGITAGSTVGSSVGVSVGAFVGNSVGRSVGVPAGTDAVEFAITMDAGLETFTEAAAVQPVQVAEVTADPPRDVTAPDATLVVSTEADEAGIVDMTTTLPAATLSTTAL